MQLDRKQQTRRQRWLFILSFLEWALLHGCGECASVGLSRSPLQAVVQITGDGFQVETAALQNTLKSIPDLQLMLSRYAVVQGMQVEST